MDAICAKSERQANFAVVYHYPQHTHAHAAPDADGNLFLMTLSCGVTVKLYWLRVVSYTSEFVPGFRAHDAHLTGAELCANNGTCRLHTDCFVFEITFYRQREPSGTQNQENDPSLTFRQARFWENHGECTKVH